MKKELIRYYDHYGEEIKRRRERLYYTMESVEAFSGVPIEVQKHLEIRKDQASFMQAEKLAEFHNMEFDDSNMKGDENEAQERKGRRETMKMMKSICYDHGLEFPCFTYDEMLVVILNHQPKKQK